MTLGEQIQSFRKTAGLSQEELGDKLGVARQSVSKWESDTTVPELDKLIAMSRLFGVSMGALLNLEEPEDTTEELTQRELTAVEEIAKRLAPPAQPAPPKKWGSRMAAGAAAAAAVIAGLLFVGRISGCRPSWTSSKAGWRGSTAISPARSALWPVRCGAFWRSRTSLWPGPTIRS